MIFLPMIRADVEVGSRPSPGPVVVGVLSDTHGHLYPEVVQALAEVDHIVHAGDVGSAHVLTRLRALAPVTAVRGNCDLDPWAEGLPLSAELELGGVRILVGHIAARLKDNTGLSAMDPPAGFAVVISGHSHAAALERKDGVLHLNPGSAGPARFGRPRTIARLTIGPVGECTAGISPRIDAEIITLPS